MTDVDLRVPALSVILATAGGFPSIRTTFRHLQMTKRGANAREAARGGENHRKRGNAKIDISHFLPAGSCEASAACTTFNADKPSANELAGALSPRTAAAKRFHCS